MNCSSQTVLLLSVLLLWQLFSAVPVLDALVPHIRVSKSYSDLYISLSEVIAMLLTILISALSYCLFWTVARGCVSLAESVLFVSCACVMCNGSGMHIACVTGESNIHDLGLSVDPLSALLHFMHEYWSHNSMLFGFFGMMLLSTWKEMESAKNTKNHSISIRNETISSAKQSPLSTADIQLQATQNANVMVTTTRPHSLCTLFIQWILPLQNGLYLSVFSGLTSTDTITACFYVGVLSIMMLFRTNSGKSRHFLLFGNSQSYIVSSVMVKTAVVGLCTLCINVLRPTIE